MKFYVIECGREYVHSPLIPENEPYLLMPGIQNATLFSDIEDARIFAHSWLKDRYNFREIIVKCGELIS